MESTYSIQIEITFGLLVTKWRIFHRPIQAKLKTVGMGLMCATRLHNTYINEGKPYLIPSETNKLTGMIRGS